METGDIRSMSPLGMIRWPSSRCSLAWRWSRRACRGAATTNEVTERYTSFFDSERDETSKGREKRKDDQEEARRGTGEERTNLLFVREILLS